MKIVHVISGDLWAGAESQVYSLITNLVRQPGISVSAVVFNEGVLAERLRNAGIHTVVLNEERHNIISLFFLLCTHIWRSRPNVVHTHRFKENVLGSLAARLVSRARSIRTVHGAPEHGPRGVFDFRRRLIRAVDRLCAEYFQSAVVAVSADLAAKLDGKFGKTPTFVVRNGLDKFPAVEIATPAWFRRGVSESKLVGFVGRLVEIKRADLFLEIAAHMKLEYGALIPMEFHIFGDGPMRDELIHYSKVLGVSDDVTFHGHVHNVQECILGLDVIVICSDYEGLPMVALEALSLGTHVVAHGVGGIPELLPIEALVAAQDPKIYAAKIINFLSAGSVRLATQLPPDFTAEINASKFLDIYRRVARPGLQPDAGELKS